MFVVPASEGGNWDGSREVSSGLEGFTVKPCKSKEIKEDASLLESEKVNIR